MDSCTFNKTYKSTDMKQLLAIKVSNWGTGVETGKDHWNVEICAY